MTLGQGHIEVTRGVATNFRLGGGQIQTEGTDSGESKPPPPNSDFSFDFAQLILEILENSKVLASIPKVFFKTAISGGYPPEVSNRGTRSPHSPVGDAHGGLMLAQIGYVAFQSMCRD